MKYLLCFFKQKTAYEVRISDWSSDVCSSDLRVLTAELRAPTQHPAPFCRADTTDQANWKVAGKARLPRDLAQLRQAVGLRVDEPIGGVAVRAVDAPGGIPHAHGGPVIVLGRIGSASCRERVGWDV